MTQLKKGDIVYYTGFYGGIFSAIVRTAHKDGSFTIESRFPLDHTGREMSGYLGFKMWMQASDLFNLGTQNV